MNTLREGLPPLPPRLRTLPIDERGFPVPYFVAWIDGKPDHRVVDPPKIAACVNGRRCWLCGSPLGRFLSFTIGPMCGVNRINSEPPQHRECAEYAVRACPFMSRPHAHRRDARLPENVRDPAGEFLKRNPGVVGVWTTTSYRARRADGGSGVLFELGEPDSVSWWSEGRPATIEEVRASVAGGLPALTAMADIDPDPDGSRAELARCIERFEQVLERSFTGEPV